MYVHHVCAEITECFTLFLAELGGSVGTSDTGSRLVPQPPAHHSVAFTRG